MGEGRGHDVVRHSSPIVLAAAAVALGIILHFTNGSVPPGLMSRAMAGMSVVVLLCAWAVLMPSASISRADRWLAGMLFLQLALFFVKRPALSLELDDRSWVPPFTVGISLVAVAAGLTLRDWTRFGRWLMPTATIVFLALGAWVLFQTPSPGIDVITFQREGLRALSEGVNPYAITMPQVYGNPEYYGPGLTENGRLLIGYPYMPLSLLLEWPFQVVFGDFRFALVAAIAVAARLLARTADNATGTFAAVLLLFTPRIFFVTEQGWTEPLVALAIAAVVYSAIRRPSLLPWTLGALFAMKQYTIFLAPLAFMLGQPPDRRRTLRLLAQAVAIAAAVTLPFALMDWPGFSRSVVEFQVLQPFRTDSLSYLAWYARITGSQLGAWVGFVAMIAALAAVIWRAPRTPAGFAAGGAMVLFAFFAFNKQAFCNYYFVVVAALLCGVAATTTKRAI